MHNAFERVVNTKNQYIYVNVNIVFGGIKSMSTDQIRNISPFVSATVELT